MTEPTGAYAGTCRLCEVAAAARARRSPEAEAHPAGVYTTRAALERHQLLEHGQAQAGGGGR